MRGTTRSSTAGFIVSTAIAAVFTVPFDAAAQTCEQACGLQSRACSADALPTMLACKLTCRTSTEPIELGTCMRECMDTFAASKDVCRADVDACSDSCSPEDGNGEGGEEPPIDLGICVDACGETLGACAIGVTTTSKACVAVCREGDHRKRCFRQCAATSRDSAKICAADFRSCMRECGAPPPITHCNNAEAPTCGGICRFMSQTCAEVEEGKCGCVRD